MAVPRSTDGLQEQGDTLEKPLLAQEPAEDAAHVLVDGMKWEISVLLKSLYFLDALSGSAWGRFGAIYYNLHGLSSQQIGLLEGLMPAVATVSTPLWGIVADKFHCRKEVFLASKAISTVILLSLALPLVYKSFERIILVSLSINVFASSGILDAYTLDMLGTANKARYGRYRLYASLSWGIGCIVMGFITDHYGFEPNFLLYGALGVLYMALVAAKIPHTKREQQHDQSGNIMDLVRLGLRPRVMVFVLECIVMGAGMGAVERLLFLFMVNDLNASTFLCGLSVGVNVVFELPIFWYAQHFLSVFGHDGMLMVSMICLVVRVSGYTLLMPSTKWLILPLEICHGITFACFWITATDIAKSLIGQVKGWNTAILSIVQTLYACIGAGLGSIIGGWAMHHYGSRELYRVTGVIVFVTLILHVFGSICSRWCGQGGILPDYDAPSEEDNDCDESLVVEAPLLEESLLPSEVTGGFDLDQQDRRRAFGCHVLRVLRMILVRAPSVPPPVPIGLSR
jgi:PPP family 3-phenylpropionic acid transporter